MGGGGTDCIVVVVGCVVFADWTEIVCRNDVVSFHHG